MTPASAASAPGLTLWHPARRAYLAASGERFTRRVARAAVMSAAQAEDVMRKARHGQLWPEPAFAPHNFTPSVPRADLTTMDETELLRRAVRGLCVRDRTRAPTWCVVMDALGLTSGAAVMLCRRLKIDPNQRTGL